jgi:hypothetical protein
VETVSCIPSRRYIYTQTGAGATQPRTFCCMIQLVRRITKRSEKERSSESPVENRKCSQPEHSLQQKLGAFIAAPPAADQHQPARGEQEQRGGFRHGADGQVHRYGRVKSRLFRLISSGVEV